MLLKFPAIYNLRVTILLKKLIASCRRVTWIETGLESAPLRLIMNASPETKCLEDAVRQRTNRSTRPKGITADFDLAPSHPDMRQGLRELRYQTPLVARFRWTVSPRFRAALLACFDKAVCETEFFGSFFMAFSRARPRFVEPSSLVTGSSSPRRES